MLRVRCVITALKLQGRLVMMEPTTRAHNNSKVSATQSVTTDKLPSWIWFDLELCSRTEKQTAINFLPDVSPLDDLTRVRPGIGVKGAKCFSAYLQMQDTHALGLRLAFVALNMSDTFDFRQAYFQLESGKTTVDVIHTAIGVARNRIDLFSGSVVQVRPTDIDTPRTGFNFHGGYATLTTLVPDVRFEPYVLFKTPTVISRQGV